MARESKLFTPFFYFYLTIDLCRAQSFIPTESEFIKDLYMINALKKAGNYFENLEDLITYQKKLTNLIKK